MEKFSVSVCVYEKDNPEWFRIALDSVLNQTIKPDEVVLVVDGPVSPELNSIIQDYEELSVFKIVRLEKNQGHGKARKIGLDNCSNELVAIMDADDVSFPTRFEKQIKAFENNPTVSVVGGMITEFVGKESNIVGKRIVPIEDKEIKNYLKTRCPMNLVTVMFKKTDIESVGGFIDWYCEEDYYLWVRMLLAGLKFANVDDVLVNVRVGKEMYSRRGGLKYFKSERKLQRYMLRNKVIGFGTYFVNVTKRFVVQVMMPNKVRGWVFKKFARS